MSDEKEFLPLGSAVEIEDEEDDIYVIISRAFMRTPEIGLLAGYQVILYPYGYGSDYQIKIIKETDIVEVVSMGYKDEKEADFTKQRINELEKRMKEAAIEELHKNQEDDDEDEIIEPEKEPNKDPFYKFRKRG
ncbi:MAG: DUF4176 domain-containing protein [Lachnospiraceae bacterium]|jgi:hypothetical protein|nr:DUF4176 domain-containing protein [Lachnospiraceae bacterium]